MNKYWFKPRRFGYGATPITLEGWAVTLGFIGIILYLAFNHVERPFFIPTVISLIVVLIVVTKKKTNGLWKWSWK